MATSLTSVNLAQLYRGYVLSFATLDVPVRDQERNRLLFTTRVVSYFAGLGRSLGFRPWCERRGSELEWWSHARKVLHLEIEHQTSRLEETVVRNLATAREASCRVGVLFSDKGPNEMKVLLYANRQSLIDALLITTYWNQHMEALEERGERQKYLVTGHLVRENKVAEFPRACLVCPRQGPLHMYFPDEGNWE